jgi:CPA1 family monovalent cation:H+ antiporter
MHTILPFFLAMIAVIVLLEMWAAKLKIAYPILLVVGGLLISFIPGLPAVSVNPDLIFLIFLPPLLFEASWSISFKEMKKWWRIITSFAFLVVFFTALSVAVAANYFLPGFTIALGFLLGGIVSPPDAISTAALTKFVKVPRSMSAILEGESLLNDASSLIIFRFAMITVGTGQFIWQEAATSFLWMVIGGAATGLLLARLFVEVHKRLPTTVTSDIALTLIEPYIMYWLAEEMHCSGVLAVVSGGLYMSAKRLVFLNSGSRLSAYNVWDSLVFILNGVVFLIIGLELPEIVDGLRADGTPLHTAIGYGVLITVVLIVARMISSYAAMLATMIFRPQVQPRTTGRFGAFLLPLVLGWTGMRGVVSLAAALSIPVMLDSSRVAFPQRNLILFITFVCILLTLVIQGLTLPYFIKRTGVFKDIENDDTSELTRQQMKSGLKQHIHGYLREKYEPGHPVADKLLHMWEEKAKANNDSRMTQETKAIFKELLECQRKYLTELNKDPAIDEDIIREQLYQIDLEEERLKII